MYMSTALRMMREPDPYAATAVGATEWIQFTQNLLNSAILRNAPIIVRSEVVTGSLGVGGSARW